MNEAADPISNQAPTAQASDEARTVETELVARKSVPPVTPSNFVFAMPPHLRKGTPETITAVPRSLWYYSWKRFKRNKLALAGLIVTGLLIVIAAGASFFAPYNPNTQILEYSTKPSGFQGNVIQVVNKVNSAEPISIPVQEYHVVGDKIVMTTYEGDTKSLPLTALAGKSEAEWHKRPTFYFGTDGFGRDVLSRLMYGARVSLTVALFSEVLSLLIGVVFGAIAGFYRGWVDEVIMWVTNVVWSIPSLLLVIAISIALNVGLWQTVIAIGVTGWVDMARIVRGQFFALRETEYVEATKALGFGSMRAIFRHMLPNSLGPIIVISTAGFASAIIYEATLSFLGLGVQPPASSWGVMIQDGYGYIASGANWGLTFYPAFAIMIAVFAFNLFGDGLRDAFDPKLKR